MLLSLNRILPHTIVCLLLPLQRESLLKGLFEGSFNDGIAHHALQTTPDYRSSSGRKEPIEKGLQFVFRKGNVAIDVHLL